VAWRRFMGSSSLSRETAQIAHGYATNPSFLSARPAGRTVLSQGTWQQLRVRPHEAAQLGPTMVKGRQTPVLAWAVEHGSEQSLHRI